MYSKPLKTSFATAERANIEMIKKQSEIFINNKILSQFTNSVSQMLVILNIERQIIYANNQFLKLLDVKKLDAILGYRTGEAVKCIYANQSEGGCGTSEFCRKCGATNAILKSIAGTQGVEECRILTTNNKALTLHVTATPFSTNGHQFTIFAIKDISDEKRRKSLERVFFHDILNSAGGLLGLSAILQETKDPDEISNIITILNHAAQNMVNEIQSERQLSEAEQGELKTNPNEFDANLFLKDIHQNYTAHKLTQNKNLKIKTNSGQLIIKTDNVLLRRILNNMINNALEASPPNSSITISCFKHKDKVRFTVQNPGFIPREIQLQIFQRSFSTKGEGRGIGTYSMKLLGEHYLNGSVAFESTPENGTTFYIDI